MPRWQKVSAGCPAGDRPPDRGSPTARSRPTCSGLLTGDVLATWNALTGRSGPQIMPAGLNDNTEQAFASLDVLSGITAGLLLPGHGEP